MVSTRVFSSVPHLHSHHHSDFCQVQTWNYYMGFFLVPCWNQFADILFRVLSCVHKWDWPIKFFSCLSGCHTKALPAPGMLCEGFHLVGCQEAVYERQESLVHWRAGRPDLCNPLGVVRGVDFSQLIHCLYACKSSHVCYRLLSQLANVYFTRKFSISSKRLDLLT